jgi:hypothetical protein
MEKRLFVIGMMALMSISGLFECTRTAFAASFPPSGMRAVADPLYGVTVDDGLLPQAYRPPWDLRRNSRVAWFAYPTFVEQVD